MLLLRDYHIKPAFTVGFMFKWNAYEIQKARLC